MSAARIGRVLLHTYPEWLFRLFLWVYAVMAAASAMAVWTALVNA